MIRSIALSIRVMAVVAAAAVLLALPQGLQAQGCSCEELHAGHDCSGWGGKYECSHPGFVHSGCDVHPECNVGVTMLKNLDLKLESAVQEVVRSGDPRFLAMALDDVAGSDVPNFLVAWRTQKIRVVGCRGETVEVRPLVRDFAPAHVAVRGAENPAREPAG